MFCRKCGHQLADDAKFCPGCGEKVVQSEETEIVVESTVQASESLENFEGTCVKVQNWSQNDSRTVADEEPEEKINWKEFLTMDNIERFAPIVALAPIAMALTCGILGRLLFMTVGRVGIGYSVCRLILFLLKTLFVVATAGATGGLVYVIVNKKDTSKVNTWVTPFATFMATISCLGIAFHWTAVAWIFGIISVLFGVEFIARITIAGMPIDSPVNPSAAVKDYKKYYDDYRAKYPTTKDLERAGVIDQENSKFDGSGIELLGYSILTVIVCAITCGLATPWMICKINKWKASHTVINGKRLTFTGSGGSLLGHWILWEILTIVTCGIYGFFVHVALRKWELNHTFIEGEPIVANGNESYFDGGSFAYFGYGLLSALLLLITCGLAYPWVMAMLQKWDTKHQVINHRRLEFSGSGLGFLGEFLIILVLSVITCGIYSPWGTVRMNKYIIRHTNFVS